MSAKNATFGEKKIDILGIPVTFMPASEVILSLKTIVAQNLHHPYFVVTANPEFLLHAQNQPSFARVLHSADLILPDGIAIALGRYFLEKHPTHLFSKLGVAAEICIKTLHGSFRHDTVPGVSLVKELLEQKTLKVFLLGGWDHVADRLGKKYGHDYYQGPENIHHATPEELEALFNNIQKAKPDVLLVSFAHFKQEEWIYDHLSRLDTKIVMGVGSSFDEILGEYHWKRTTPPALARMGLKWLWRLMIQPSHIVRVWNAVIVFPWTLAFGKGKSLSH